MAKKKEKTLTDAIEKVVKAKEKAKDKSSEDTTEIVKQDIQVMENTRLVTIDIEEQELLYDDTENSQGNYKTRKIAFTKNFYFETHDSDHSLIDNISEEEWKERVKNLILNYEDGKILKSWLVFHDRCKLSNGDLKELHCHGFIEFENQQSRDSIMKKLDMIRYGVNKQGLKSRNLKYFLGKVTDEPQWLRYLTHRTENAIAELKRPYEVSDLILFLTETAETTEQAKKSKDVESVLTIIEDLEQKIDIYTQDIANRRVRKKKINSEIFDALYQSALIEIARSKLISIADVVKYMEQHKPRGSMTLEDIKVYISNKRREIESNFMTAIETRAQDLRDGRHRSQNVFVSGLGGTGKTEITKQVIRRLLDKRDISRASVHKVVTAKDGDWGDKYTGQIALFFDDLSAENVDFSTFVANFDENNISDVKSRYSNKTFINDYCFITKSTDFDDWIKTVSQSSSDWQYIYDNDSINLEVEKRKKNANQIRQVKRRFSYHIDVQDTSIILYKRNVKARKDIDKGDLYEFKKVKTWKVPAKWAQKDVLPKSVERVCDYIADTIESTRENKKSSDNKK